MFVTSVGKDSLDLGIFGVAVSGELKVTDWAYSTIVISWFLQACKIYTVSMINCKLAQNQRNHIRKYLHIQLKGIPSQLSM